LHGWTQRENGPHKTRRITPWLGRRARGQGEKQRVEPERRICGGEGGLCRQKIIYVKESIKRNALGKKAKESIKTPKTKMAWDLLAHNREKWANLETFIAFKRGGGDGTLVGWDGFSNAP